MATAVLPGVLPSLSADGRYVVFQSYSPNVVSNDANGVPDVFVYDANNPTNPYQLISIADNGTQGNNDSFTHTDESNPTSLISADGRYVVFQSRASNLVTNDPTGGNLSDIFIYDRTLHHITRVPTEVIFPTGSDNGWPSISASGQYIAWEAFNHIYIFDQLNNTFQNVPVPVGRYDSDPSISGNGQYVVYSDYFSGNSGVYVYNLATQAAPQPVSEHPYAFNASISDDGRYVAYEARDNTTLPYQIYLFDFRTGLTTLVSHALDGSLSNGNPTYFLKTPVISGDGNRVYFASDATNLGAPNNDYPDIYSYDVLTGTVTQIYAPTAANSDKAYNITTSADGRYVAISVGNTILIDTGPVTLFSAQADNVDFNHLDDAQKQAIAVGADIYHALNGDDVLTPPDSDHYNQQLPSNQTLGWDYSEYFDAGVGDDTFDFENYDLTKYASTTLRLDGSADNWTRSNIANGDVIKKFSGAPNDYKFDVQFTGDTARQVITTITPLASSGLPAGFSILAKDIEHIGFKNQISNVVALTGATSTDPGSVAVEMLRLASEVYGPQPTLQHFDEPLAYEAGHNPAWSENISFPKSSTEPKDASAVGRGWHPVAAVELGMTPADFGNYGLLKYSFVGGHYQAYETSDSVLVDYPEANALVLTGVVTGKRTLAIAFRGTDQYADFYDYFTFNEYYRKYQPLIAAIDAYLTDSSIGIQQVLVSGHSLGAGALQYFLQGLPAGSFSIQAFTDGSPGSEAHSSLPLENFIHTDDLVPKLGNLSTDSIARGILGAIFSPTLAAVLNLIQRKTRDGSNIYLDSDVASTYSTSEHNSALYLDDATKLLSFARDGASPFYHELLAADLRADQIYTGPDIRIALGAPKVEASLSNYLATAYAPIVRAYAADDYVLGNDGDDTIVLNGLDAVALGHRAIDGGGGFNMVQLTFGNKADFTETIATDGGVNLSVKGSVSSLPFVLNPFNFYYVGTFYRIGAYLYRDQEDFPDRVARVQRPASGSASTMQALTESLLMDASASVVPTMVIDPSYDYADAGDGDLNVVGTSGRDIVYLGSGNKTVSTGAGDDIIVVRHANPTDQIVIDGGPGADVVVGGGGNETFYVDNPGDQVIVDAGTDGHYTVEPGLDYTLPDNVQDLVLQDGAVSGTGNSLANRITGNSADDILSGGGGNDYIDGGAGNNTAVYSGNYADYSISDDAATRTDTITDLRANSPDGTDTITNIEMLQFANALADLDTTGGLEDAAVYNPDGTYSDYVWDVQNQNPWSRYIISYDTQSRAVTQATNYDDGTKTTQTWDVLNQNTWSDNIYSYDTQGRTTEQTVHYRDTTFTAQYWDLGGQNTWSSWVGYYDSQNRETEHFVNKRDGTYTGQYWDVLNQNTWSDWAGYYDANNHETVHFVDNRDGTHTAQYFDVNNQNTWTNWAGYYDSNNQETTHFVNNDDGSRTAQYFDVSGQYNWSNFVYTYDDQNRLTSQTVIYDDSTRRVQYWDAANTQPWATIVEVYAANGAQTSRTVYNDDGSHVPPVVLDLDGNGIAITPLSGSTAFFDVTGSGERLPTAWVGGHDGLLAIDLGADGQAGPDGVIDQAKEINFTLWAPGTTSDLAALRQVFDTDHDGKLDLGDARWNEFRVRTDPSDGVSQPGEVKTLSDLGITSIDLSPSPSSTSFPDGSSIQGLSSFTRSDGSSGLVGDVALAYASRASGPDIPDTALLGSYMASSFAGSRAGQGGVFADEALQTTGQNTFLSQPHT